MSTVSWKVAYRGKGIPADPRHGWNVGEDTHEEGRGGSKSSEGNAQADIVNGQANSFVGVQSTVRSVVGSIDDKGVIQSDSKHQKGHHGCYGCEGHSTNK